MTSIIKRLYLLVAMCCIKILLPREKITKEIHSILIIRKDDIGDVVNTLYIIPWLMNKTPKAPITFLCAPYIRDFLVSNFIITEIVREISSLKKV